MKKIIVEVGDRQALYLKRCLELGFYGDSVEEVVERFISQGIARLITDKIIDKLPIKAAK